MKNYLYAIGAIFCWASLPAATGSGLSGMSIEYLMAVSFSTAAVYLYIQDVLRTGSFRLSLPSPGICLLGVWGIFIYHYVYYSALKYTPLAEGAILTTTWSFWIVVFSAVLLFRRLHFSILLTAMIGMAGAAVVIAAGKELEISMGYMTGYLLCLACGVIWSSFSVALSRVKVEQDPMTAFTIFAAVLSLAVFALSPAQPLPSAENFLAAMYLGCVPLGLSFFLWSRAVRGGNMVVIGYLSYFTPPLAVLMVSVVHDAGVSWQVGAGMGIILLASIGGRLVLQKEEAKV